MCLMKKYVLSFVFLLMVMFSMFPARAHMSEINTIVPMGDYDARVKLRVRPGGDIIGQYYQGTEVIVNSVQGEWKNVTIGERTGWMMAKYLHAPVGDESSPVGDIAFPDSDGCIELIDSNGKDHRIPKEATLHVLGTIGDTMLHVAVTQEDGSILYGDCISEKIAWTEEVGIGTVTVQNRDAATPVHVRADTSTSSTSVARLYPGTEVRLIFDHHNAGDGWRRVRNGSVSGYMKEEFLLYSTSGSQTLVPQWGTLQSTIESAIVSGSLVGTWERADPFLILGTTGSRNMPLYYCQGSTWLDEHTYRTVTFYIQQSLVAPRGNGAISACGQVSNPEGAKVYVQAEDGTLFVRANADMLPDGTSIVIRNTLLEDGAPTGWGPYITSDTIWVVCDVQFPHEQTMSNIIVRLEDLGGTDPRLTLPDTFTGG